MRFVNKEIITGTSFLCAFVIFIMSSYGVGKAESDDDRTLKEFAIASLFISLAGMAAAWLIQYGLMTPPDTVSDKSTQSVYLFLMYLIPVAIGMGTSSASAYGLGKHEKNIQSTEYKVSLVFFILGLVISVVSTSMWASGNYMAKKYETVLTTKEKLFGLGQKYIQDLKTCENNLQEMKIGNEQKSLEEAAK